jgi:heme exporter protein CcmD
MSVEALKMGNYGAYVWSSYGLILIGLIIMAAVARNAAKRELKTAQRRNQINQSTQSGSRVSV